MLDKAGSVGDKLCHGKNIYKAGGIVYGSVLAPKKRCCLKTNEFGSNIDEHKTSEGFNDSKNLLNWFQYFTRMEGEKLSAMLPKVWKKSFNNGIIIAAKKTLY